MEHTSIEDPAYHAAVVDLLGVLAYGELTAFIRMAVDSDLAPTLHLKSAMAAWPTPSTCSTACSSTTCARTTSTRMPRWGRSSRRSPPTTSAPRPGWLEGLVKAYVGDGIAKDFYREMSACPTSCSTERTRFCVEGST